MQSIEDSEKAQVELRNGTGSSSSRQTNSKQQPQTVYKTERHLTSYQEEQHKGKLINSVKHLRQSKMRSFLSKVNLGHHCCSDGSMRNGSGSSEEGGSLGAAVNGVKRKKKKGEETFRSWDNMEYAESQNSVATMDLFRYAILRERLAIGFGILFMWYAASWQPISVFILAIMASLMGQYSKQTSWLQQWNNSQVLNNTLELPLGSVATSALGQPAATANSIQQSLFLANHHSVNNYNNLPSISTYDSFHFLSPLHSFVAPIFDLGSSSNQSIDDENIRSAVHDILRHESDQFLRKSFEINGSAFLLALTQLLAFFVGMTLITWAAKRQSSRVKILYFSSCLHQEVTWFEAIDSASGSGSSLNALMEKYEDGIGVKLALLSYFLGHVALFSITAFYQMFRLAIFCMPFVLLVGLVIAYLSELQAVAIGQHALFAKRSLQLAEEIIAAIRTVFAFNGQQKEITRYSISLQPVYRKSLVKHLYTALNTSLSKFSIFACFAIYCFYAMRLFPPFDSEPLNKSVVLAVMRGAEVSIVNILISIPFMEALQQSKGSIARIYAAIERRSKIDPASKRGSRPNAKWQPSISFRMVQFGYAGRSGPTRRRSTLPFLNLAGSPGSLGTTSSTTNTSGHLKEAQPNVNSRRRSLMDEFADALDEAQDQVGGGCGKSGANNENQENLCNNNNNNNNSNNNSAQTTASNNNRRRSSAAIKRMIGAELHSGPKNERILSYFNLEIRAGQSVALVGPSGSGKSTVLALVQRLYDTTGGSLLIGQHNIKDLNVGWLRNQIGVVTQEPRLFDMTIAENIRLGLGEQQIDKPTLGQIDDEPARVKREATTMQQVMDVARLVGAHEFICRLPQGYNTRVGSGGVQLSGGQKQRIAIARALIRKPKILLLDESTSALDTESESQVQNALKVASKGRTTVMVAHRLATIKHVDLIVVMNQGQVVECGNHENLMENKSSLYRSMYLDQVKAIERVVSVGEEGKDELIERSGQPSVAAAAGEAKFKARQKEQPAAMQLEKDGEKDNKGKTKSPLSRVVFDFAQSNNNSHQDDEASSEDADEEEEEEDEEEEEQSSGDAKLEQVSIWQLLQFVELPKWSALIAVLVCLLAGLILPMNLIAHSYLFSAFAYDDPEQLGDYLYVFGLLILSFSTFVLIVAFLQVILPGYVGEKMSIRLRVKMLQCLLNKPMFYFDMDSNSPGSLCDRFNSYISSIQSLAGTRIATMLEAISTLTAGAFFGFGQNIYLSLFCLSFALLVLLTTIIESRIVQRESLMEQKFDTQLAHLMTDALSNIKTIASLNKERVFIDRFSKTIEQREIGNGRLLSWLRTFLTSLKFVMPAMSWSASMYYGCHLLVDGRIDLQTIFIVCPVVLFAVNDTFRALVFLPELLKARKSIESLYRMWRQFSPDVLQTLTLAQQLEQQHQLHLEQVAAATTTTTTGCSNSTPQPPAIRRPSELQHHADSDGSSPSFSPLTIQRPKKSISFVEPISEVELDPVTTSMATTNEASIKRETTCRRVSNLIALPSYMRRKSSRLNSLVPRNPARGRIEFKEVEFAYPNRPGALVLDGFTLNVAPGESVALVGGSGSGKSTCVSLLEKFYDYHAGRVTLDGRDLRLVEAGWVRSQIALVSQEPTLLSYSIGDNIRYGDNGRFVSMDEVVEAARTANIHDFIMSLPDQYDTELSSSSYSSSQLSGGQRQRIAIARALIRNAPILIFDEATSALDTRNETIVQDALNKARRGRTNLTIAHRLATIKDADKIAVLKDGKLVELGKHDQLMENENSFYRSLWKRQEG